MIKLSKVKKIRISSNLFIILVMIFTTRISDGISTVVIPAILEKHQGIVTIIGSIIGLQSLIGILIFLPQATFIKKVGEKFSIRLGLFLNLLVYGFYMFAQPGLVAVGKFAEGFGDRLLNSTTSKLIYDETDNTNNRGRVRALMDAVSNISVIVGPIIAGLLIGYSFQLPLGIALFIMGITFVISKKIMLDQVDEIVEKTENKSMFSKYYKVHIEKYFKNKFVVALTIPSIMLSGLGVFYSLLLSLYLLKYKGFSYLNIATLWSVISAISVLVQIPSGYLADKNRNFAFLLSAVLFVVGFYGLINIGDNVILNYIFILITYSASLIYTTSMSALFGDVTTVENRLSESETYRMFRALGEGIITIIISRLFDINIVVCLGLITVLVSLGALVTYIISKKHMQQVELEATLSQNIS
ncbi:hypothetical protein BBF96_13050 [Anoxybacter fermentans]|uniref:Major facilitator superfamily (MFS) profile domain-containing protein n=1 Tax=Anoxybacter fermentans TaxID=1323375 RepID=A0A3Q9HRR5_9FIRM|nr:MFS transporter [Anoxybacter fermentans]AZR74244.1 hypothetical protein BBF96_13050 [Anoxybacter fermentans]